jgi:hypothetical protein
LLDVSDEATSQTATSVIPLIDALVNANGTAISGKFQIPNEFLPGQHDVKVFIWNKSRTSPNKLTVPE